MIRVNTDLLTALRHRFDEQVTEAEILSWLYNFDEDDWETALILLNHISYYSDKRCCNILENGIKTIANQNNGLKIVFFPIGGIGKSGGVMAYYIKKLMPRFGQIGWVFADPEYDFSDTPHCIVLLDDFIGSGRSAKTLLDSFSDRIPQGSQIFCLCVAYMRKAGDILKTFCEDIFGDEHLPAFSRRHSIFGYPPRMKTIRDFALKYGTLLHPKRPYTPGMNLYIGPLGYANCQSLICFDHTTPNNTLPILWESKLRNDNRRKWAPLFPRKLFDRTKRDDSFERMKYKWISISQKINIGPVERLFNDYSKSSIQLLGLLHCYHHHRSDMYACTLLEITVRELEELRRRALDQGLLTEAGMLSEEGKSVYEKIRKEEFRATPLVEYQIDAQNSIYLPNKFLGLSRN